MCAGPTDGGEVTPAEWSEENKLEPTLTPRHEKEGRPQTFLILSLTTRKKIHL